MSGRSRLSQELREGVGWTAFRRVRSRQLAARPQPVVVSGPSEPGIVAPDIGFNGEDEAQLFEQTFARRFGLRRVSEGERQGEWVFTSHA